MSYDEPDVGTVCNVVVNHEEQYSIWPAHRENPAGWRDGGMSATTPDCLAHIGEVSTDIRPVGLPTIAERTHGDPP